MPETLYYVGEAVFIVFSMFAVIANFLIIYTILRYGRTRTVPNIYIANWAFADIFCTIVTPSTYNIVTILYRKVLPPYLSSWIHKLGVVFHCTTIISVMLLVVDWFIAAYFERISEKLRRWYKIVLAIFWLSNFVVDLLTGFICGQYYRCIINEVDLIISFGVLVAFVLVNLCFRGVQKCRRRRLEYPMLHLSLAALFVAIWTVGFSNLTFISWYSNSALLILLLDCFTFSSSVFNFIILYKWDQNFKACFRQAIRCSNNRYEEPSYRFNNPLIVDDRPVEGASHEEGV